MTLRGQIKNGVVVFENADVPPDGTLVEVTTPVGEPARAVSAEQRKALLELIGMWKMENPPDDAAVQRIIEEERMRKYR